MLQYIARESSRYSIPEQVQMALEGGCGWIQLDMNGCKVEDIRSTAMEIIPLCQEYGAFFVLEHDVELVNELKIHGVHLSKGDMAPLEAREVLGPEAVIGVNVSDASDILKYKGMDIDYLQLRPGGFPCHNNANLVAPIVQEAMLGGNELPIVGIGSVDLEDIPSLKMAGCNGVAIHGAIIDSSDPVSYTEKLLNALA